MSNYHGQINRLKKEVADLRQASAREAKREADLTGKLNRAQDVMGRTKSDSTYRSKARESERALKDLAAVQKKRADIDSKIANKSKQLSSYGERQAREDEKTQKRISQEQQRLVREREAHDRRVSSELRSRAFERPRAQFAISRDSYDFFVSHASEDKDGFVRELAEALRTKGANVWYDEFTLKVGDSLRQNIDRGLANSRFGIVVLSENFFKKQWPNRELDGLVAREVQGHTRILPIWHKVSKGEVAHYSPMLADKVALNSSLLSVSKIADELVRLL